MGEEFRGITHKFDLIFERLRLVETMVATHIASCAEKDRRCEDALEELPDEIRALRNDVNRIQQVEAQRAGSWWVLSLAAIGLIQLIQIGISLWR